MTRMRVRAPVYLSTILFLVGLALGAHATQAVSREEMESYVLRTIGAAGVVMFGAFWVLLNSFVGRAERAFSEAAHRIEESVKAVSASIVDHDKSPFVHKAASDYYHGEINERLSDLNERVGELESK